MACTCGNLSCFDCYSDTLIPILLALAKFLGHEIHKIVQSALKEIWKAFHEWLKEKYGGWNEILKTAFDKGEQAAISALEAVKDEIIKIYKENHTLLEQLAKFSTKICISSVATKQGLKTAVDISVQQGMKQATTPAIKLAAAKAIESGTTQAATKLVATETAKSGTKEAVKLATAQATKSITAEVVKATAIKAPTQTVIQATKLTPAMPVASAVSVGTGSVLSSMATPMSIVTGAAQVGLEAAGYTNVGKTVGATGSMTAGGIAGLAAGPPGVVLGAATGLGVWIAGEIVGGLVDRAIGAGSTGTTSDLESSQSREEKNSESTSREDQSPRQYKGKPSLNDVLRKLLPLAVHWHNIGILLGIEAHVLQRIQYDNSHGCSDCLREMLNEWLNADRTCTWINLAEAIEPFHQAKADEIRKEYIEE